MDDLEFLEEQLESKNIHIDYRRVEGLDGLYSLCADGHEVIAVAPDLTRNKKTAVGCISVARTEKHYICRN